MAKPSILYLQAYSACLSFSYFDGFQLLQYFEQIQLMAVSFPLIGTSENDKMISFFCNLFIIRASFESM